MEEAANGRGRRERVEGGRGVGRARERQREGERWKEKVAAVPRQSRCTGEREPSATN